LVKILNLGKNKTFEYDLSKDLLFKNAEIKKLLVDLNQVKYKYNYSNDNCTIYSYLKKIK